jgi:hypothetical protein
MLKFNVILLCTILGQHYLKCKNTFYRPNTRTATGSPISGTTAETSFQGLKQKYCTEKNKAIVYYARYVDDIPSHVMNKAMHHKK